MDIQIDHLVKVYRGGVRALDGVSLHIGNGTFGLLGPNGAGKTTLIRVLVTLIRPTGGDALVDGMSVKNPQGKQGIKRILGYLPQEIGLYPDLTAEEFVDYAALLKGMTDSTVRKKRVAELLNVVNLWSDRNRKLKTFSGGMKRRVGIAQAIINDPKLLVVDEPTAGLDPEERIRFRNLLEQLGRDRTVLLSTHIIEDIAQSCQRLAVQAAGRIIFNGTTTELAQRAHGMVWQMLRKPGEGAPNNVQVIGVTHQETGVAYRVVGQVDSRSGASPLSPTLEDGYVALMQQHTNVNAAA